MKVVLFSSLKGGVGKTSIAYNTGGYLGVQGYRILHIDMDMQANLSENFGVSEVFDFSSTDKKGNICNVLLDGVHPQDVIVKNPLGTDYYIDLIPSSIELFATETILINNKKGLAYTVLNDWIKKYHDYLDKEYDFIIIDVGPYLGIATQNALYAADEIFLITDVSMNGYKGVIQIYSQWNNICETFGFENKTKGVIVNQFDTRQKTLSEGFESFLEHHSNLPFPIFYPFIRYSSPFKSSELQCPLAINPDKKVINSTGYQSFMELMKSIQKENLLTE